MFESNERNRALDILSKSMPSYREAYSDRTAWLMAYMAELAYLRFDPPLPDSVIGLLGKVVTRSKKGTTGKLIGAILKGCDYDPEVQNNMLKSSLEQIGWELVGTISMNATQAYVACNDNFAVLAFRGTEADRIGDIKADAKATQTTCPTGGRVHSGFKEQYDDVAYEVEKVLDNEKVKDKPLFVTGHSLGGAVATIATRRLTADRRLAACYTYGSPRVGTEEWVGQIKTPIYRIVNSADPVPLVPFGGMTIFFIAKVVRAVGRMLSLPPFHLLVSLGDWIERTMSGYAHAGNMRFLTDCEDGDFSKTQLLYTVGWSRRFLAGLRTGMMPWGKIAGDHGIQIYRRKLMNVAEQRNPEPVRSAEKEERDK